MKRVSFLILFLISMATMGQVSSPSKAISIPMRDPDGDPFLESELIETVSYIDLKIDKFGAVTSDMELDLVDNYYFILDNKFTNTVYRFDPKGTLLGNIGTSIATAGSTSTKPVLNNPAMFNVDPFQKQVEIYNFENSLIERFTYSGKKVDQITINVVPADFVRDKMGSYWLYTGWNNSDTQYRLLRADKNGRIVDRKMRLVSKCMPTLGYSFSQSIDAVYLWELLGNSTYKIEGNEMVETFRFDFGSYTLPPSYHTSDPIESFNGINTKGYFTVRKYLENHNYAYFFLNFLAKDRREMIHVIYEKKTGQFFRYNEDASIAMFDKAQALTENDELIFLVTPRKMRQMIVESGGYMPESFEEVAESVKNYRNPVVLKVKLQPSL